MKISSQKILWVVCITMPLSSAYAGSGYYLGARSGWAAYQDACDNNAQDCVDDTFAYGIYGGYQFNSWLALEGGATSYGSPEARYPTGKVSADIWGSEIAAKFSYPLADNWDAFTRLGASYQDIDKDFSNGVPSRKGDDWNTLATIGVSYKLFQRWSVRGEYQFIDGISDKNTGQADLHFTSLGLTYHFGQKTSEAIAPDVVVAPKETKKIIAPAITPRYLTEGAPMQLMFDFNSSKTNITNGLKLLAEQLHTYPKDRVQIIGHTDSTGTEAYNQKLSVQRAQTVANYLMNAGISKNRLTVAGLGETSPIATNYTIEGRAKNRRVDVFFDKSIEQTRPVKQLRSSE